MTSGGRGPGLVVHPVPGDATEDVLVEVAGPHEGSVLTGTADGAVLRVSHDGRRATCLGRTGGRPLGLEWLGDGRVLVCDAHRGLLALDPATSRVEVLVGAVDGVPLRFCNNAAVAADGAVWFSDSSRVHGLDEWEKDFARLTRTGRLLRRAPDGEVTVHLDGLAFANGVVLGPGDAWVAVAETAARTVVRLELTGPRAGERSLLAGDLPGYPDNLAPAADGGLWVALASPRDAVVEAVQRGPLVLRRALSSLPEAVRPSPRRVVQALELGPDGTVRRAVDVRDPAALARFHMVTGVREHDGRLWLGSLRAGAVAVLDLTRPT